jgi:hypothetical protein
MAKVHKMKAKETGGLPFMQNLLVGKPYQMRTNIDVLNGLVKGRSEYCAISSETRFHG